MRSRNASVTRAHIVHHSFSSICASLLPRLGPGIVVFQLLKFITRYVPDKCNLISVQCYSYRQSGCAAGCIAMCKELAL